jgi:hypothetical protein
MRTNPEDFVHQTKDNFAGSAPKFYDIASMLADTVADPNVKYYWFLNDAEKKMLTDAYRDLCRKSFENKCMQTLLEDKQEHTGPASVKGFGRAQIQAEGQPVGHFSSKWTDPRSLYGQREDLRYPMYGDSELYLDSPKRPVDSLNPSLVKRFNSYFRELMGK